MASFMKGDTFLEVASSLARTDISDPASFSLAVEVVKRYVRAKIKRGKGKEVAAPGGKLERLEAKYAHLGFQDVFYLTRLQLALPPSAIDLPRPLSPTRRVLVQAKYPLPPAYQVSLRDETALNSPSSPAVSAIPSGNAERRRGRGDTVKELSWARSSTSSLMPTPSTGTSGLPVTPGIEMGGYQLAASQSHNQLGISLPQQFVKQPLSPTPMTIPRPRDEERDHFDHLSATPEMSLPPKMLFPSSNSGVQVPLLSRKPSAPPRASTQVQRISNGDEKNVRHMLQARINALQTALHSLEVDETQPIPISSGKSCTGSSSSAMDGPGSFSAVRNFSPAPSPPPQIPLPPLPTSSPESPQNTSPVHSRLPTHGAAPFQFMNGHPNQSTGLTRTSSHLKRLLATSSRSVPPSPSTGMMFDLEPEIANDPFAMPTVVPAGPRFEREQAAYIRSRGDLRRIKIQTGDNEVVSLGRMITPPPRYEVEGTAPEVVGRAI